MKNDDLIKMGFEPIKNFTIGNSVTLDLGRNRHLSASSVGTPNEMVYICSTEDVDENEKKVTDLICIHNYDYDGFLTEDKIKGLISILKWKNPKT